MYPRFFRPLCCLAALLITSQGAVAQVYKWVDERGVTHYGERPAASAKASKLPIALQGNDPVDPPAGCYTIRCQYERMRDDRLVREAEWRRDMQSRAERAERIRAAQAPPPQEVPRHDTPIFYRRHGVIVNPHPTVQRPPHDGPRGEPQVSIRMRGR